MKSPCSNRFPEEMFENIRSETSGELVKLNVRFLIKIAGLRHPGRAEHSGRRDGRQRPDHAAILKQTAGRHVIDRSSMDAWEANRSARLSRKPARSV